MIYLGVVIIFLLGLIAWQNRQWAAERSELLQRIQAPEIAVHQHVERPERKAPMAVPIDDDAAYAAARERRVNGNGD